MLRWLENTYATTQPIAISGNATGAEHLGAHHRAGQRRVGRRTEHGHESDRREQRHRHVEHPGQRGAERGADDEQRRHLAAVERRSPSVTAVNTSLSANAPGGHVGRRPSAASAISGIDRPR